MCMGGGRGRVKVCGDVVLRCFFCNLQEFSFYAAFCIVLQFDSNVLCVVFPKSDKFRCNIVVIYVFVAR